MYGKEDEKKENKKQITMLSKYLIYHTYWGENKQQEKIKQITVRGKHLIYHTYWEEDKQTNKNKTLPEAQRTSSYPKQVHFTCFDTIWPLSSPCWTQLLPADSLS